MKNLIKNLYAFIFVSYIIFFFACQPATQTNPQAGNTTQNDGSQQQKSANLSVTAVSGQAMQKNGITLTPFSSPDFPNAELYMRRLSNKNLQPGPVTFDYEVHNYQLGNQTPDSGTKMCANSKQGQHIHHILNGEPYRALYQDTSIRNLAAGHYISMSFLSRSYHESIKQKEAYVLHQFNVGNVKDSTDISGPLLFYSRPKGDYIGEKDTKKVMLDFYLANTDLQPDGNKVKATINGTEFLIDHWQPYLMEGLPLGENSIKLELIDKKGNLIPGPYNSVERKIKLLPDEPLPQEKK